MNKLFVAFLLSLVFVSCKNKPDSTKVYFSVVDFIGSQIRQIDTTQLSFTKITTVDSLNDTSKITKEEFKKYAKEFLDLPDIASSDKMNEFKETNDYDETLGNVLLIYTPKKEDAEIRNETIMMQPDDNGNTHVKTILIHTINAGKDSTVEKNMTWHVDKRFQIVTKVDKANQPEKVNATIIQWQ